MNRWALIVNGEIVSVVIQQERPSSGLWESAPDGFGPGDEWNNGNPRKKERFELSQDAFWERWTQAERINLDLAMQHDPAAANGVKRDAAKWRYRYAELLKIDPVNMKRNRVESFVRDAETAAIIGVGRADQILAKVS